MNVVKLSRSPSAPPVAGRFEQELHHVNQRSIVPPFPGNMQVAVFGLGCFWGAERVFWTIPDVYVTAAGYSAGTTANPTYEQVCSGMTGHAEVVQVVFDPDALAYERLLQVFFESHDPTQGMRQGNDIGTQYRSGIYSTTEQQQQQAITARALYQQALDRAGRSGITTEIASAGAFYYAEPYHQQYLAKNPSGYCGLGGTGVCLPTAEQTADEKPTQT